MISTMLMSAMGVGVGGFAGCAWAADVQCLKTPSCEELGYTEVACFQNNGVKCPYGDKYFCVCPMTYKYSCTGTGYTGGVGEACNGKYTECACKEGYNLVDGECIKPAEFGQCNGYAAQCSLGDILFSDGTCSANKVSGKTPIAVVVYKSGNCGQALALKSIGNYEWGGYGTDISTLPNKTSAEAASKDYDSCGNSEKIMAAGNKSKYPAVWAANEYKTEGTSAGDWCLPAAGIFTSYYNNQTAINLGFEKAGGTTFTNSTYAWSSSESDTTWAWVSLFNGSYGLDYYDYKYYSNEVRPVIEF